MPEASVQGSPPATNGNGTSDVSFPELVRAHHLREKSTDPATGETFKQKLDDFQAASGQIVDAYWCREHASAVVLTRKEIPQHGLFRRAPQVEYRLHRVSDWVFDQNQNHAIADLLHDSDILAIKAAHSLEGVSLPVVMQWLFLVDSHLLGFLERYRDEPCHPAVAELFEKNERAELIRIEEYYFRAGEKWARMRYVEGMLGFGVVLVLVAALAAAGILALFGALDETEKVRGFYAALAAGGIGAVISVLMRMSGRGSFTIDHELSRREVMLVGAYRPLIGAVSGVIVYFLFQTPLMPMEQDKLTIPFYVVVAFLAGFSERWTKVVLSGAMRTIGEQGERPADTPTEWAEPTPQPAPRPKATPTPETQTPLGPAQV